MSDEVEDLTSQLTEAQAKDKLWRLGNLEWKLRGVQQEMRRAVYDSKGKKTVFLCARRLGKTFVMMLLAVEQCIKQKDSIVKILFPKKKDAKDVARFQMREILKDCPIDLKPEWKEADKMFVFPNGSEIQMAGTLTQVMLSQFEVPHVTLQSLMKVDSMTTMTLRISFSQLSCLLFLQQKER